MERKTGNPLPRLLLPLISPPLLHYSKFLRPSYQIAEATVAAPFAHSPWKIHLPSDEAAPGAHVSSPLFVCQGLIWRHSAGAVVEV